MDAIATYLKTLGHPDRLRILALLSQGELTISELVQILGLSQPRVTQYIKSLEQVGIVERMREGSWVFSRLKRGQEANSAILASTLAALSDENEQLAQDRESLSQVRAERSRQAEAFFASVANDHGQLGHEYLPQTDIETALLALVAGQTADLVTLHQVLHFLEDPSRAVMEAARLLGEGGHLLITDFAMHDFDNYHEKYAHRRLGFSDQDMQQFLSENAFKLTQLRTLPASEPTTPDVKIWYALKTSTALSATG